MSARSCCAALVLCVATLFARGATADEAPPDSTLDDLVHALSDSTDAYFGVTAAGPDTAGLDSVLAYQLANPRASLTRNVLRSSVGPWLGFNRVDGPQLGAQAGIGTTQRLGRLIGRLAYASGPNDWIGSANYRKRWTPAGAAAAWTLSFSAGRWTQPFDRDHPDPTWAAVRAFVNGGDFNNYLRRDGVDGRVARIAQTWQVGVGLRDQLESSRATTATWNLLSRTPVLVANDSAAFGRAREARFDLGVRVPRIPVTLEAEYWTSGRALGSDFNYRRTRVSAAGDFALTTHVAIAPQFTWGRLTGQMVPQDALYLGGSASLRSFDRNELQGSGQTFARVDIIGADDVLTLLHIPHPAAFPIQIGGFAATGAVWGRDDQNRLVATRRDWPDASEWRSEAGFSVLYRPGIPDPEIFYRFDYVIPIGPDDRSANWRFYLARPLNLLKFMGE